jgi:hypothetical protein
MYTCRDADEHWTDEREGALRGWVRVWHRFHVTVCPHCRAGRRLYEQTVALSHEIPPDPAPERLVDAALSAFRDRAKRDV